ncbi:MAG: substrate-binding domain-containing protein, partial [Mesotoga sp.]|nr:substrate-binding domain-containing protein [Mesotoga sp.]
AGMFLCSFDIEHLFSSFRKPFEDPTVLVDSYSPLYDSIYIDNELGGYLVGRKLSKFEGSIHVIMMQESIDSGFWPVFNSRLRGFQKALLESGKNLPPRNVHSYDFSWSAGALAARDIFDNDSPPFNIFAMSDLYAFGVMREAQLRGLRIGQDVKLVGYDDQSLARDWGITTVRQPIELMGEKAVDMMLERLEKPGKEVENLCLKPEMVERESA